MALKVSSAVTLSMSVPVRWAYAHVSAEVLLRLERDYEAVALLDEFLSRDPNNPHAERAHYLIQHASLSVEDARKAVELAQSPISRAVAYNPHQLRTTR